MEKIICPHCDTYNSKIAKYCSGCGEELPKLQAQTIQLPEEQKKTKKSLTKEKVFSLIAGIIAFILAYGGAQYLFSSPSIDKSMMQMANEVNKSCPMMIDNDTRLDNAMVMPDNGFQYNYTLVNMVTSEADIEDFKQLMLPRIINVVKTEPEMKSIRENKITMAYNYKDQNGIFLCKLVISPADYE